MLEHAIYTVASPEACAAILWKDSKQAPTAATALKITAKDLQQLGIIDSIISESPSGAHSNPAITAQMLKKALLENLAELNSLTSRQRQKLRYEKFRQMGVFLS